MDPNPQSFNSYKSLSKGVVPGERVSPPEEESQRNLMFPIPQQLEALDPSFDPTAPDPVHYDPRGSVIGNVEDLPRLSVIQNKLSFQPSASLVFSPADANEINRAPVQQMKLFDGDLGLKEKIEITGVHSVILRPEIQEEPVDPLPTPPIKTPSPHPNASIVQTLFQSVITDNSLDNLQELLAQSLIYKDLNAKRDMVDHFRDPKFPPNEVSLVGFGKCQYIFDNLRRIIWLRPQQFDPGLRMRFSISEVVSQHDIVQGELGDCYLIAALCALAEHPDRIRSLFLTKKVDSKGIYCVALCISGVWQVIEVDDYFPCHYKRKAPLFSRTMSGDLWVAIIEKAWAKVHSGFGNISSGLTRETLRDVTGASAKTFFVNKEKERLWKILVDARRKKFLLTTGSDQNYPDSDVRLSKIGLAGSHAYTILDVVGLLPDSNALLTAEECWQLEGKRPYQKLLKLRNPWAKGEVKSRWSFDSPDWPPAIRAQIQKHRSPGVFFLSFEEFRQYFCDIQVCYYHDNYKYCAKELTLAPGACLLLQIDVTQKGRYYFSVNQKNKRSFNSDSGYKYSPIAMLVAQVDSKGHIFYDKGCIKADKENWVFCQTENSRYLVVVRPLWQSFEKKFSFSVNGPAKCSITVSKRPVDDAFMKKFFACHAEKSPNPPLKQLSEAGIHYKMMETKAGFGYAYLVNKPNSGIEATITVEMLNMNNATFFNDRIMRPTINLKPGQSELVLYAATNVPYSIDVRFLAVYKPVRPDNLAIKDQNLLKFQRKSEDGKPVDIFVKVVKGQDGEIFMWKNNTPDYTCFEFIEFNFFNCRIKNDYANSQNIIVRPNSQQVLKIVKINPNADYRCDILTWNNCVAKD